MDFVTAIARIAPSVRKAILRTDDRCVREVIAHTQTNPGHIFFSPLGIDYIFSNWRHIGTYKADFGSDLGLASRVQSPGQPFDGMCYITPRRGEGQNEPCELHIGMTAQTLQFLTANSVFQKYFDVDGSWSGQGY